MECFCLGLCITLRGGSCKWPLNVAFRFHSICYTCTFQEETTLLCLSIPALGRMANLVTSNAGAGGLVWAWGVRDQGWDILSQPSEMPCRQPFIRLRENKPKYPHSPPAPPNDCSTDNNRPRGSLFPTRLSLLPDRLSFSRSPVWFYWRGNRNTESLSVGSHLLSESLGNGGHSRGFTQRSNESWTIWPISFPTWFDPISPTQSRYCLYDSHFQLPFSSSICSTPWTLLPT